MSTCCCRDDIAPAHPYTGSLTLAYASYTIALTASPRLCSGNSCMHAYIYAPPPSIIDHAIHAWHLNSVKIKLMLDEKITYLRTYVPEASCLHCWHQTPYGHWRICGVHQLENTEQTRIPENISFGGVCMQRKGMKMNYSLPYIYVYIYKSTCLFSF